MTALSLPEWRGGAQPLSWFVTPTFLLLGGASLTSADPAFEATGILDRNSDRLGSVLGDPGKIGVDAMGNVYVTDPSGNNVFKVAPDGVTSVIIRTSGDVLGNPLVTPS